MAEARPAEPEQLDRIDELFGLIDKERRRRQIGPLDPRTSGMSVKVWDGTNSQGLTSALQPTTHEGDPAGEPLLAVVRRLGGEVLDVLWREGDTAVRQVDGRIVEVGYRPAELLNNALAGILGSMVSRAGVVAHDGRLAA